MMTTIALLQSRVSDSPDENVRRTVERIQESKDRGAEIVCLPELFRTPYFCQTHDPSNFGLAETIPGPTTEALGPVAKILGVTIIASVFEARAPGLYHNTAV